MRENEDLRRKDPEMFEKLMSDPIQEIFEGLDPRDLEVLPEERKSYPGSKRGMLPQDDPKHYSEWVLQNLPKAYRLLYDRTDSLIQNYMEKASVRDYLDPDQKKDLAKLSDDQMDQNDKKFPTKIHRPNFADAAETPLEYWQLSTFDFENEAIMDLTNVEVGSSNSDPGNFVDLPVVPDNLPFEWDSRVWFLQNWGDIRDSLK